MFLMPLMTAAADLAMGEPDIAAWISGTFTNEEQVYFDKEAKRNGPPWLALQIKVTGDSVTIAEADAFGGVAGEVRLAKWRSEGRGFELDYGKCARVYRRDESSLVAVGLRGSCGAEAAITRISAFQIEMTYPDGRVAELRRARPVNCWVSIRKGRPKADGSDDWFFDRGVLLHDQGGRALVGAGQPDVEPVVIRMRRVTWDKGSTNKPALTLYIHKAENPQRAESYSWAAPDSTLVGINLRWVQSGCAIGASQL